MDAVVVGGAAGIAPSDLRTLAGDSPDRRDVRLRRTTLGRVGRPEGVARAIVFLARRETQTTGATLHANGGGGAE